jgi:hypothetical protein
MAVMIDGVFHMNAYSETFESVDSPNTALGAYIC